MHSRRVKTWFTVGAVIEAKATSGKWWPAAVISRGHDGGLAFDVDVRDGQGTKWERMPRGNLR